MSNQEPSYLQIKGVRVGIMGLREVLEELSAMKGRPDREIADAMFEKLKTPNYIPLSAADEYRKAFVREFKKHIGEPVSESEEGCLRIVVLGPGCPSCDQLEQTVLTVLTEENIPAEVEHIRDPVEIARYGVMGTPALVVNGKIKSYGLVPNKQQIIKWLKEI